MVRSNIKFTIQQTFPESHKLTYVGLKQNRYFIAKSESTVKESTETN
jgi:hypothetical protein